MRVLVTGASGFLGAHVVRLSGRNGFRNGSSELKQMAP